LILRKVLKFYWNPTEDTRTNSFLSEMREALSAGFSNVRPLKEALSGRNPSAPKNGK
jgi:hypothetical protein